MTLQSINPTTGEPIRDYPEATPEEAAEALAGAHAAFEAWRRRPFAERSAPLRRAGKLLRERREELADKLIAQAERRIPGLSRAGVRHILTPEDFLLRVHQQHHSFGGLAPVMGRPGPRHQTPIKGLWFLGSQSQSAGGVAGVMKGARTVVRRIDRRSKRLALAWRTRR